MVEHRRNLRMWPSPACAFRSRSALLLLRLVTGERTVTARNSIKRHREIPSSSAYGCYPRMRIGEQSAVSRYTRRQDSRWSTSAHGEWRGNLTTICLARFRGRDCSLAQTGDEDPPCSLFLHTGREPELPEERLDVADEQIGNFHGGGVTAAVGLPPGRGAVARIKNRKGRGIGGAKRRARLR